MKRTYTNDELAAMWPTVPDGKCNSCEKRGPVTWVADRAMTFCAECLHGIYGAQTNGGTA